MPRGEFDRSSRRARTRAALLDAAARVYARRGFDAATLDEVAEEAGFTKGAVYDHFGSKENLLIALLDEHLAVEVAEQVALFDPSLDVSVRPRAGADRWMQSLTEDPDVFRLFVELWVHAQRDESLRGRVLDGMEVLRATLRSFGAEVTARAGRPATDEGLEAVANIVLGLSLGLGMIKLVDDAVPQQLLGGALAMFFTELERFEEAKALLEGGGSVAPGAGDGS
jgi:AcrR family transcriptional regulator